MEIKFYGDTCFEVKGAKTTVLINPNETTANFKADIVLGNTFEPTKKTEGARIFDWPGEYEIKEIPISGYPVFTKSKSEDSDPTETKPSIIFCFRIDDIKVCHLGELGHAIKSELVKEIGDVDVLMIEAGGGSYLSIKKAEEIIENLDPRVVLPMGNDRTDLLNARSLTNAKAEDKLVIKSKKELQENDRLELVLNVLN